MIGPNEILQCFDELIDFFEVFTETQNFQQFRCQRTIMSEKLPEINLKIQLIGLCSEEEGLDVEYILEIKRYFHVLEG